MKVNKIVILTVLLCVSLLINTGIVILGVTARKARFISYSDAGNPVTAAAVVSVPDGSEVAFGRVDVDVREGESVFLQYSIVDRDGQANWDVAYLYDGNIVRMERKGFGTLITALKAGECLLQTVTLEGIKDVARITVIP